MLRVHRITTRQSSWAVQDASKSSLTGELLQVLGETERVERRARPALGHDRPPHQLLGFAAVPARRIAIQALTAGQSVFISAPVRRHGARRRCSARGHRQAPAPVRDAPACDARIGAGRTVGRVQDRLVQTLQTGTAQGNVARRETQQHRRCRARAWRAAGAGQPSITNASGPPRVARRRPPARRCARSRARPGETPYK